MVQYRLITIWHFVDIPLDPGREEEVFSLILVGCGVPIKTFSKSEEYDNVLSS